MRVGIVGSRRRACEIDVRKLVDSLPEDAVVVSGGCSGPDTWAEDQARKRGLRVEVYHPVKKGAGYGWACRAYTERNKGIAESVDVLYAFAAEDRKGGTEQTIRFARKAGVKVVLM